MAATFNWCQDNGTQTGSPAHGTTQSGFSADTHYPTQQDWKNADDNQQNSGTAYSAAPITAGNNSYTVFQYGKFTGSFNQVSAGLWAHTSGTFGTGLTLKGTVTSTYATPSTTTNASLTTDMTTAISIGSGLTVDFSTTGPYDASPTSSITSSGYTQYLATQLQTTSSAAAGDTASAVLTLQYNEN
ncbi:MAG TPA: hypothetical protein VGN17_00375 [Bryobacteraceae bacterium]|jgi:hypothetical protein